MSEDKKSLINLVPEALDNAAKNLTDKPTQNMGTTLADIWYLVFGGISHASEKRKLKYSYALQEFENRLKEEILKTPEDKTIEADLQVVAPALESSKYCVEKSELRDMFIKLIASSMNSEKANLVHPIFTDIINHLSSFDAILLKTISANDFSSNSIIFSETIEKLSFSLAVLKNLGLIESKDLPLEDFKEKSQIYKSNKLNTTYINKIYVNNDSYIYFNSNYDNMLHMFINFMENNKFSGDKLPVHDVVKRYFSKAIQLTTLGLQFKHICID